MKETDRSDNAVDERRSSRLSNLQRQELERRLADHRANPDDVIPWEQIEADALARYTDLSRG